MSNFTNTTLVSFTLNMVSGIVELAALCFSSCLLLLIIYRFLHAKYYRDRVSISIPIILSINTLCLLIIKSLIQLLDVNLNAFRRDLKLVDQGENSFFCRFRGYAFFSVVSALYWSCALQAIFRFTRVLYPSYFRLYRPTIYLYIFIPGQILFAFSSVLPNLFLFDAVRLIPDEVYCTVIMNDIPSLIYLFAVVFGLPLNTIVVCYICIICKMRHSSCSMPYQRRNERDYRVIRHMMIVIGILSTASLPAVIDLIICVPTDELDPLIYRIEWVSASINALVFAISLPFVNPQLYELLKNRRPRKRHILRLESNTRLTLVKP